jgi:hypothetical protein
VIGAGTLHRTGYAKGTGWSMRKPFDGPKDCENRSDKSCCCGGHNAKNYKKNLYHHSTKSKLSIRKARRIVNMTFSELLSFSVLSDLELFRLANELTEGVENDPA